MKSSSLLVGGLAALIIAGVAQAQATSAPREGQVVRGQNGVVLGEVERVIYRSNGAPAQILVRPRGPASSGPRSLSVAAVRAEGDSLSAPLTQAEFNAMPVVNLDRK